MMDLNFLKNLTVKILTTNKGHVIIGSGFILKEGNNYYVVTAAHCICEKGEDCDINDMSRIQVVPDSPLFFEDQIELEKLVGWNREEDWAVLKILPNPTINNFPIVIRSKEAIHDISIHFRGCLKITNSFRTFFGKIIDFSSNEFVISLTDKSFSGTNEDGAFVARGLSGSGVLYLDNQKIFFLGIVKSVFGDDAYFDDIKCCPVNLLDEHFINKSLPLPPPLNVFSNSVSSLSPGQHVSKFVTSPGPIVNQREIVGREEEIDNVKTKLLNENVPIAITGIRGIGKTSIVKSVVNQLNDSFDHIGWVSLPNLNTDFDEFFASKILIETDIYTGNLEHGIPPIDRIITSLVNLEGKKLLVIENIDPAHIPKLRYLTQRLLGWNIVVTSYSSLENLEDFDFQRVIRLPIESAREMFLSIYQHPNHPLIDEVVNLIGRHTLTIEIIAKTCKYWGEDYSLE